MKLDWAVIGSVLLALVLFKFIDKMFLDKWAEQQFEGDEE